jgi:hypothetical protein
MVSMLDGHVVINPPLRLDLDATDALMNAVASAVRSGVTVMVDLDVTTLAAELVAFSPLTGARVDDRKIGRGAVTILGAGRVRLATAESYWTIDIAHSRLCRTEKPIECCFLSPHDWVTIRALWVNYESVTALTSDGTYLSTRTVWAS